MASRTLTKDTPTFIRTTGSRLVSKVTKAPQAGPEQAVLPGATPDPSQVPTEANGRLNRAEKYSV